MKMKMHLIRATVRAFYILVCVFSVSTNDLSAQQKQTPPSSLKKLFLSPPPAASPWVFWYWMQAAISKEGITADLEAMKEAGIGGAYLMTIKDSTTPPVFTPVIRQLTPEWWEMISFAVSEAKRLNLKLAMHVSDGFALAGGPWITPELSMQKIVWSKKEFVGGKIFNDTLPQPETNENYYRDIAVYAYPSQSGSGLTSTTLKPTVTSCKGDSIAKLLIIPGNTKTFATDDPCWIVYQFEKPFTCRTIRIQSRNNFQSNRLLVEVSDDGISYRSIGRLTPPRHGWQDTDAGHTHSIKPVTAKYFRFVYDKTGTEPGAEDIDAAKWRPALRLTGIELSAEPLINQYEGKSGQVWRISKRTSAEEIPDSLCIPKTKLINVTRFLDKDGRLNWSAPAGNWTILRIGHTSTGHKNATGGGGRGLECDKFNPAAIKLQFDSWFAKMFENSDPLIASSVIKIFHVDSWECGSQNWSPVFRNEFLKRRGYDLIDFLPAMAGIPVESADVSERFLYDVRETIAELIHDNFYKTLADLAHAKNCVFTAESVAPTMMSDGMLHYKSVDVPMGEFWLNSPTHDKPNDMLDAISAAHIYGKNIVQAEAFTELRSPWDEHPGTLKTLQDRNYALGINRLVYHVFMHNPWMNRKPGMTLDGIGLFFQRDQTWWKPGKAWVDYARTCQALLQFGKPVVDIAVFTGEEFPRRSILPERLVPFLPGIFGEKKVLSEKQRLENTGQPMRQIPAGVNHSANITDASNWNDPVRGYAYDSYNKDALVNYSQWINGSLQLKGGAKYKLLVLPGSTKMNPNGNLMSPVVANKLKTFIQQGGRIIFNESPIASPGLKNDASNDSSISKFSTFLEGRLKSRETSKSSEIFKGVVTDSTFDAFGIQRDFIANETGGETAEGIAWTHRAGEGKDLYFVSNQLNRARIIKLSLRVSGKIPELWNPVSKKMADARGWRIKNGRTEFEVNIPENGSIFIVFEKNTKTRDGEAGENWSKFYPIVQINEGVWTVTFDTAFGGPFQPVQFEQLIDWSKSNDSSIRYYSGTAVYEKSFNFNYTNHRREAIWLDLGDISNLAEVKLNGVNCGTLWTRPYKVDISKAIRKGQNRLIISVTNTWANRIIGDQLLSPAKRVTNTNAPFRLQGKPLLPAGLLGPVGIFVELTD